jgi:ferredoxin
MRYRILDECVGCESCITECPNGAIVRTSDKCEITSGKCDGCAKCVSACPVNAIVNA